MVCLNSSPPSESTSTDCESVCFLKALKIKAASVAFVSVNSLGFVVVVVIVVLFFHNQCCGISGTRCPCARAKIKIGCRDHEMNVAR